MKLSRRADGCDAADGAGRLPVVLQFGLLAPPGLRLAKAATEERALV